MNVKEKDNKFIASSYARFPVTLVSGEGALVYDDCGKEYIDLGAGIAVNTFGYSDKKWVEAVTQQISKLSHTSNLYYTEPGAMLAEVLCEKTGFKKVFFSNSGAEANECAIKAARKYSHDKYGDGRYAIVTLINSFHGRTVTTLAATGQDVFHKDFNPFTGGFIYAKANDIEDTIGKIKENNACAVMVELIQGEGGVMALDKEYVSALYDYCQQNDVLFVCDEVQTGNGRSGKLYAYMNYGIMPDIISTAKGLGGGLPIGATLLGEKVEGTYTPGTHGSTFGGNPVCCAAALSVIERLDDTFFKSVKNKSKYVFDALEGAKGVKSVSGMGLMIGIETERPAAEVIAKCREKGVLVLSAKTKVRLLPPLNIEEKQLEKAIDILKEVLGK